MKDYYYGTIGKDDGWYLLANKPILVWSDNGTFAAYDNISEADEAFVNSDHQKVYFWENGRWNPVNFLVEGKTSKKVMGFNPIQG